MGIERDIEAELLPRLAEGEQVLVAVSGGADSVAMLHALVAVAPRHGWRVTVAHLDHRIRGQAARDDAVWVAARCERLGVPCVTGRSDVPRMAARKGMSLEMAAREARYRFLARTARRLDAQVVLTAHTADDQAETVLLKLCRGAGTAGLGGMRVDATVPGSRIPLVRPLLQVRRGAIEAYLEARGVSWREDATNRDDGPLRNRVRHEVLPLLEARLNPGVRDSLCRTAEVLRDEDALLAAWATEALQAARRGLTLDVACLPDDTALARRVMRQWLVERGVPAESLTFECIERLLALVAGRAGSRALDLGAGQCVRRRYGILSVESDAPAVGLPRQALAVPGVTTIDAPGLVVTVTRDLGIVRPARSRPGVLPARVSLSQRAVGRKKLYVRSWRPGDRMHPRGMRGSRKLQDILCDAKVPADQRRAVPVLECGGEIVWLPGYRIARGWGVAGEQERAIQVHIAPAPY